MMGIDQQGTARGTGSYPGLFFVAQGMFQRKCSMVSVLGYPSAFARRSADGSLYRAVPGLVWKDCPVSPTQGCLVRKVSVGGDLCRFVRAEKKSAIQDLFKELSFKISRQFDTYIVALACFRAAIAFQLGNGHLATRCPDAGGYKASKASMRHPPLSACRSNGHEFS
ncbi:hypothetical protein L9Z73_05420 [Pseudomonas sp. TNT11]|jgi:hypothetical protein|uniref:Uncharacterized protein n=1 Tax=Pseudomonas emilianonis TaxID=2915812 RepID=A0ABT0EDM2_9PSED|nr:hypothetical protein [Pseudomonas emilianonis]MCK1783818.1 hypothetical protein [Pseudomonas emilianonis]